MDETRSQKDEIHDKVIPSSTTHMGLLAIKVGELRIMRYEIKPSNL